MFAKIGSGLNRNAKKYRKKAVDDGSTALIFTYTLITKNSDIYEPMLLTALDKRETFLAQLFL